MEKTGTGTLDLTTANEFNGSIIITQGTLKASSARRQQPERQHRQQRELMFVQAGVGSFADNITGSGSVEKTGAGDLTLEGANSFSGGLTISEGKVIGDAAAIPGNVSLAAVAGTQLVFDQGTTAGTHAGNITGGNAGGVSLVKRGTGKLTLTGSNSFLGDTSVEAGELEGNTSSLPGNIALGAGTTISFNQTGNGTFDDVISGSGQLVKRGGGSLSLIDNQTFTGNTTIEEGTLVIGVAGQGDGAGTELVGGVTIQDGGILSGIGRVNGAATAQSGSRITPGGTTQGRCAPAPPASPPARARRTGGRRRHGPAPGGRQRRRHQRRRRGRHAARCHPGHELPADRAHAGSITGGTFTIDEELAFFELTLEQTGTAWTWWWTRSRTRRSTTSRRRRTSSRLPTR